jgi:multidrug efflux pump subunit AcrA (membrane-fusion protein)
MIDRGSLLVAVPLGAVVTGCGDRPRAAAPPPPPIVKAEPVVERDVPISAEWVGTLVGYISAQIRPRVSGHLISQNYTEGAAVKTGDLLFQVDPRPYQVALDQAEAQLLQAESQLSQAKAQVSASQAQVEQALAKVAQGEAEVTKTAADQRRTELDVARYTPLAQRGVNMPTDDGGQRCTSWR